MKHFIPLFLLAILPLASRAQDSINPYTIQLPANIILHYTDVYYRPFAPPAATDTHQGLSSQNGILSDPNGLQPWPYYQPVTHDSMLANWRPYGIPIGPDAGWQRLFTARDKWDRSLTNRHSDIIAGGDTGDFVIVSKNEDVDFRASGRIWLKHGFHVKPGAFFHAYTEPHWDTAVFTDDFDSTAINQNQWYIPNGSGGEVQAECSFDSDVRIWSDPDAIDGKALDIVMREDTDTCTCNDLKSSWMDGCVSTPTSPPKIDKRWFTSAVVRACPWPWIEASDTPLVPQYQHAPYGKYEFREKIPHVIHHSNNWLAGAFEFDINELFPLDTTQLHPSLKYHVRYGPYKGMFHTLPSGQTIFVSNEPHWSSFNNPQDITIDNFHYDVDVIGSCYDTVIGRLVPWTWPTSLKNSTDSITFYYARWEANTADTVMWKVDTDAYGKWRIFSAPYHVAGTDTFRFSRSYQPYSVTLTTRTFPGDTAKACKCHWEHTLNAPVDKGIIYLDDTMSPLDIHNYTEAYSYNVDEHYGEYITPSIAFNTGASDTVYKYHTYSIEFLPHELRFLYDSNVVSRAPDRLIPAWSQQYDAIAKIDRAPPELRIGEFDIDYDSYKDTLGVNPASITYQQRKYFEAHVNGSAGCWPVNGQPAAHHLVDYVRIWDVPKDVQISEFPQ